MGLDIQKLPCRDHLHDSFMNNFLRCRKSPCDVSEITTKAPYEAALTCERHVRIEISDFVMALLSDI